MRKKVLYVDVPFSDIQTHTTIRSNFIWRILSRHFDADVLLIKTPEFLTKRLTNPAGYEQLYAIASSRINPLKPAAVHQFTKENRDKFTQILQNKRYEMIFFRSVGCAELINLAEKTLPECNLVIDAENLLSRQEELNWQQNPVWKEKNHKIEFTKLRFLENSIFKQANHFFFANHKDMTLAMLNAGIETNSPNFMLLPDSMPMIEDNGLTQDITEAEKVLLADKFILFYGNLETNANLDAFSYIARDIYPRISKKLQEKDIKVYIVGKNRQRVHEQYCGGRLKLVGEVKNLNAYIKASLLIILPIRIDSGAMTRIMEAALLKKTVLTTTLGAEGLDLSAEEISIENQVDDYCNRLIQLLQTPGRLTEMGQNLFQKAKNLYDRDAIEKSLVNTLNQLNDRVASRSSMPKLRIAVITNGFEAIDSDIERYSQFQIKKLSEIYEVVVFRPRRSNKPRTEVIDNLTVNRLFDVLNYPVEFPNKKTKTLCPELFFRIMKSDFDIIQCYPGINGNNILAYIAARIKVIPVVLCSLSLLDYPAIFEANQKVNPDVLHSTNLNWGEKLFLRNLDYIFTASEKEYAFLRKLNERIEQVPLTCQYEEIDLDMLSMREKYNIDRAAFVFLCIGTISTLHGQDIALKAFTEALTHLPDSKLVFVGKPGTETEFIEDFESFIDRESLQDDVIIASPDEPDEIVMWLREANISLIPARFSMADSTSVNSWSQGIPVLQSDAVDPNLVIDDHNGYLFRSEDIEDLSLQMQRAFVNKSRLPEMGAHGKTYVTDKCNYNYLLFRYSGIYKQLTT